MTYETDVPNTKHEGVRAEGLGKRFGDFWALQDLDLDVPAGSVLGLLGHNGAGKTTAIRILTTLSQPTTGRATVAGFDVERDASSVRGKIGVAGQASTVDGLLTGRANLEMVGRLYGLSSQESKARATDLLEQVRITDSADKLVKDYSGGMRRRVDLAASLVAAPTVLFLDEPTTGLDPQSRKELWTMLRDHVDEGGTLVLTTQYLEEADRLADDIVVLDHGRVAASGTPAELKRRVGGDRIEVSVAAPADLGPATDAMTVLADGQPIADEDARMVSVPVAEGTGVIEVVRALDVAGVPVTDVHLRSATLDDVFLSLTSPQDLVVS